MACLAILILVLPRFRSTEYHLRGITQRDEWEVISDPFVISSGTIYTSTGTEEATVQMTVIRRDNVHRRGGPIPEQTIEATAGMAIIANPTQVVLVRGVLSTMVAPDFFIC